MTELAGPSPERPVHSYEMETVLVDVTGKHAAREVFLWQRQVVRTPGLSKLAYRIAIELSQAVDRRAGRGYAVRTHQQLGEALSTGGAGRSKTQEAIAQLRRLGYLRVEVSHGPGSANRYRLSRPAQGGACDDDDLPPF